MHKTIQLQTFAYFRVWDQSFRLDCQWASKS